MPSKIWLLALLLLFSGCSSNPYTAAIDAVTGAVTGDSGGPHFEVKYEKEEIKGKKEEENEIKVAQSESNQTATTIINNQDIPIEFMLLAVIGWLLPSPNEIWRGFLNLVKLRRV